MEVCRTGGGVSLNRKLENRGQGLRMRPQIPFVDVLYGSLISALFSIDYTELMDTDSITG